MKWEKLGLVYVPSGEQDWALTHAAVPIADQVSDDIFRIYFGARDINNSASVGYIEIDINRPHRILRESKLPVLSKGDLGTFDDSGVLPSWITTVNERKYLYYVGWNLGVTVPFRNFTGLAISDDNGDSFKKFSRAPIMDRDDIDPFFFTNPCVIFDADNRWKMWYLSCVRWTLEQDRPKHYYHLKYAESNDGVNWQRNGQVAIDFKSDDEYAISRPSVIKEGNQYKMWFSARGETYRIGYAVSDDGIEWNRMDDKVGIDVSESGWDSDMIEYPYVFSHEGDTYMLYNGNGYGKTGFGLAVLVEN